MSGTVLITGGAGFIGAHTAQRFAHAGLRVVCVDPLRAYTFGVAPSFWHSMRYRRAVLLRDAEVVVGSTEHYDDMRRVMCQVRPRYVVHLGGLPLATAAVDSTHDAFESIGRGTLHVLQAIREAGTVEKLVFVSSSMVYGDFPEVPVPETAPPNPKDMYGGMKLVGEVLARTFGRANGPACAVVRPSAVYGPTDVNGRIVQRLMEAACFNVPVRLRNPETTALDFTYVTDVAEGLLLATLAPVRDEIFNITAGQSHTLAELHAMLRDRFPDMPVEVVHEPDDFRPRRGALDVSKARAILGYRPRYQLKDGLAAYLSFVSGQAEPVPAALGAR